MRRGALRHSTTNRPISRLFAAAGLITIEGSRITVTEEGRPFVRLVAAAFDAYLPQSRSRHSIAV
jgi:oxygen-independent coproporphyrinogen III oxidase